ncbi:MAG TPA: hypothetical protein VED63_11350, partial [Acidimicrobiales bacterium]|nr:hypothetical protein [Acidimicrobiales bacterium]
ASVVVGRTSVGVGRTSVVVGRTTVVVVRTVVDGLGAMVGSATEPRFPPPQEAATTPNAMSIPEASSRHRADWRVLVRVLQLDCMCTPG